jgi:two-component system cell cycle response regulator
MFLNPHASMVEVEMEKLALRRSESIKAHLNALQAAQKILEDRQPGGMASIRRILHSFKSSALSTEELHPPILKALSEIEKAQDANVGPHLRTLLQHLKELTRQSPANHRAILLVEDDPLIIHLLEKHLVSAQMTFYAAQTLKEAALILSQKDIALVVLDLGLPDGDGRDFLLRMRGHLATRDVPIIVLSSKSGNDTQTECFALGADAFFEKPVDPMTLSTAIAAKLQRFADLTQQASLDAVTRLPNRMVFYRHFAQAARLAARTKEPLTVAILDLDRFKAVNDTSGHQMGDHVLKTFAALLLKTLRTSDLIARWGGEEFAVLFPNTDLTQARFALNKALTALRKTTFETPDKKQFRITFSAGVTPVDPKASVDEAIAIADRYLYLAKTSGRNRVASQADQADRLKRNILLVEDDDFTASLLRGFLEKAGFRIFHAKNAKIALALSAEVIFSLITLDVRLPDIDGFEILRRFRENPNVRHVPVIMLTSKAGEEDVIRGFRLGADDYIIKPFAPSQLLARVHRFLEK